MPKIKIKNGKLKKNYRLIGASAITLQYGTPITFIAVQYDVFTFKDPTVSITGWGFITLIILFFAFRRKIKDWISEIDEGFGDISRPIKWTLGWATTFGILFLVSMAVTSFIWVAFSFVVGGGLSIYPHKVYYARKKRYKEIAEEIKKRDIVDVAKDLEL